MISISNDAWLNDIIVFVKIIPPGIIFEIVYRKRYDTKTKIRCVPALLPENRSENQKETEPWNF
jgi:hypothetical protein